MKSHLLRPRVSGVVLLAAISAVAVMWVRAQTTPPPALHPIANPPPEVTPPPAPVTQPGIASPLTIVPTPKVASPAAPKVEAKSAATDAVAKPAPSWGATLSPGAYYIEKMEKIVFPEVQLHGASMDEVVGFLRIKSREFDTFEKDPAKKGVNLILKPGSAAVTTTIDLDLKDVPMAEVLKYATELAGMKYKVEAYAVLVIPSSEWNAEMYTRVFRVPPDFLFSGPDGASQTALDFLKAKGIPFPEGSSASFAPDTYRLTVRNKTENLAMLEMMVEALKGNVPVAIWERSSYYAEKLHKTTLPAVQFRGATLDEAVELLRKMGRDYDTFEKDPNKKGFNIVLRLEAAAKVTNINLDLKDVPMAEALKYITELAGMKYKLEPYAVVILPQSDWATELFVHIFKVPSNFLTSAGGGPGSTAMEVLKAQGVQFPDGSSASLLPDTSLLMVRNTIQSMYEVENVIENSIPRTASVSKKKAATPVANERVNTASVTSINVAAGESFTPLAATPAQVIEVRGGTLQEAGTGGNLFFVAENPQPAGSGIGTSSRAHQLLRDTELKVLLRHFESTVTEIADGEKARLVEADAAKREMLDAKLNALRGWKAKLVASINGLTGVADAPAAKPTRTGLAAPTSSRVAEPASDSYGAVKATGAPDADNSGGDSASAWAPASTDAPLEWLSLTFESEADLAEIQIHETNTTGALSRVVASLTREGRGVQEFVVWNGNEPRESTPFVRHIALPANFPFSSRANGIRLEFQPTRILDRQEIDAVMLVGRDGSRQWAKEAKASSYWSSRKVSQNGEVPFLGELPIVGRVFQKERAEEAAQAQKLKARPLEPEVPAAPTTTPAASPQR